MSSIRRASCTVALAAAFALMPAGAAFAADGTPTAPVSGAVATPITGTAPVSTSTTAAGTTATAGTSTTASSTASSPASAASTATRSRSAAAATSTARTAPAAADPTDPTATQGSPQVWINHDYGMAHAQLTNGQVVSAGSSPHLGLEFELPADSTYTDLHFTTSDPGSAAGCSMQDLYDWLKKSPGWKAHELCSVTLPALAAGQTKEYKVTFTGKRDGKPFSVSYSAPVQAAQVDMRLLVDGKDVTGRRVEIAKHSAHTFTYVITNRSQVTFSSLTEMVDDPSAHEYGALPQGATKSHTVTVSAERLQSWVGANGEVKVRQELSGQARPGWVALLTGPVTELVLVDRPGTGTAPAAGGTRTASAGTGTAVAPTSPATATPPLASTGLPVGEILAGGLAAVAAGAGALVVARRRR